MMPFTPKELTWLGVAKETTWGTAVAPTFYPPFKDVKPDDVIEYVKDQGIRGAMAQTYNVMPGPSHSTFEIGGEVFPDIIGLLALLVLGKDTVTGAASPYTHSLALNRTGQPNSYTASYYDGTSERQFAGQMVEELSFKWAEKAALEYTLKSQGLMSAVIATGTPAAPTTTPIMSWQFAATLGGAARVNVVGFDISFKRKLYVQHAANNTQNPTAIIAGGLEVTGKLTVDKEDDVELSDYLNNTQPSLVLTGNAGAASQITFQMSKCAFLKDPITAKEVVQGDIEWEGVDNATDGGPALIKVVNAVASY